MTLYIINHEFLYELESLCRIFFPFEKIKTLTKCDASYKISNTDDVLVYTEACEENKIKIFVRYFDKKVEKDINVENYDCISSFKNRLELAFLKSVFKILCDFTGIVPPWGILTGVRPVKLARRVLDEENDLTKAKNIFINDFLVSNKKTELLFKTMLSEKKIISLSKPESFSLYISIPFCPSRCNYCSFVSQSIEKAYKTLPKYFDLLLDEISYTAEIVKKLNLRLETVYIGGGTPTTLSAEQLKKLLSSISKEFNLNTVREFTIEAGRPDTINRDKLTAIKNGVDNKILRISINPQSMNDNVLQAIGRKHTSDDTRIAIYLAKDLSFENINMDVIAGLPQDDINSFKKSINEIIDFSPQSITVHTLALKKSAKFNETLNSKNIETFASVNAMLEYCYNKLPRYGYNPYYLYRQSKMVGNLENTGFAKNGFEGLYNEYIMDETHTIIACGAGAVTKLQQYGTNFLQRIFNFKFSYEYISRYDEIIEKKKGVEEFYGKFFPNS